MKTIFSVENLIGICKAEIQCIKIELKAYEKIKEVIKTFDGKMLNVKIENAINDVVEDCYVRVKRNEHFKEIAEININCASNKRGMEIDGKYHYADYFGNQLIGRLLLDGENKNRVNSKDWLEKIEDRIQILNKHLVEMTKSMDIDYLNELQSERDRICSDITEFNDKLGYPTTYFLGITQ